MSANITTDHSSDDGINLPPESDTIREDEVPKEPESLPRAREGEAPKEHGSPPRIREDEVPKEHGSPPRIREDEAPKEHGSPPRVRGDGIAKHYRRPYITEGGEMPEEYTIALPPPPPRPQSQYQRDEIANPYRSPYITVGGGMPGEYPIAPPARFQGGGTVYQYRSPYITVGGVVPKEYAIAPPPMSPTPTQFQRGELVNQYGSPYVIVGDEMPKEYAITPPTPVLRQTPHPPPFPVGVNQYSGRYMTERDEMPKEYAIAPTPPTPAPPPTPYPLPYPVSVNSPSGRYMTERDEIPTEYGRFQSQRNRSGSTSASQYRTPYIVERDEVPTKHERSSSRIRRSLTTSQYRTPYTGDEIPTEYGRSQSQRSRMASTSTSQYRSPYIAERDEVPTKHERSNSRRSRTASQYRTPYIVERGEVPTEHGGSQSRRRRTASRYGTPYIVEMDEMQEYTGDDPEMRYLKRSALCMTADDFSFAGENLLLREHVLDLRFPEAETTLEHPGYPKESDFDAIRINSWPVLKALARLPTIAATVTPKLAPYVFWEPFLPLTGSLPQLEKESGPPAPRASEPPPVESEPTAPKVSISPPVGPEPPAPKAPEPPPVEPEPPAPKAPVPPPAGLEPPAPKVSGPPPVDPEGPERGNLSLVEELSEPGSRSCDSCFSLESFTAEPDDVREIKDIEYFIDFVRNVLKEDLRMRHVFQSKEVEDVSFNDLCNLFQIGPESYVAGYFEGTLRAFQMVAFAGGGNRVIEGSKKRSGKRHDKRFGGSVETARCEFHLVLLYLDFNGSSFCVVRKDVKIHPFLAKRPIRHLPVFPMHYLSELELEKLKKRGTRFLRFAEKQAHGQGLHRYYTGLSLNQFSGSKEDIDAEVIVDHDLALQHNSDWAPMPDAGILSYDDLPRSFMYSGSSAHNSGDGLGDSGENLADTWLQHANNLVYQKQSSKFMELCNSPMEEAVAKLEDMKLIAHVRVFAFVLRSRKWVKIDIDKTNPIPGDRDAFESLVLPPGHKKVVQALVMMHSHRQGPLAQQIEQAPHMDLVRGKGKGLILLLHGAPGVGKTSTAECVAAYARRPLFPITCGDIGYEPQDVETNLENNFRLAHHWGCVLLLDEADVFLGRRDKHDLKRNSMVSVFLRVLEYYSGILFLTTNRVGTLDEAFKSRIHISLYYPPLDLEAYTKVWVVNLQHLQALKPEAEIDRQGVMKFARANYQHLNWNGRQIRNAFQTAYALAEYQVSVPANQGSSTNAITKLNAEHFAEVAQITLNFEQYLFEIYGGDDGDRAKHDQLRRDHWGVTPRNTGPVPQRSGLQMPGDWTSGAGQGRRGAAGPPNWPYKSHGQNPPPPQGWQPGVAPMPGRDTPHGQEWAANATQMSAHYPQQNMPLDAGWPPNPPIAQGPNPSQNPMPMRNTAQQPPPQNLRVSGSMFGTEDTYTPLQTPAPYQNPANGYSDEDF